MIKETIHLALARKLGREPTPAELKADVQRIIGEGSRSRYDRINESPRYRADMIDAGRGRLVR